jgi:fibronectin type 3 domain-containing protein
MLVHRVRGYILLILLIVVACSQAPEATDELTYDAYLAFNPPPPENLTAKNDAGKVLLTWDAAEVVKTKHYYEDIPLAYKIFRRTENELEFMFLAETSGQTYTDSQVQQDVTYFYSVSGVYRNLDGDEIDGSQTSEVEIAVLKE